MSHIAEIKTEVRDTAAVEAACRRLGLAQPTQQTVRLFSGEVTGLAIALPGWRYAVICDVASGAIRYDNFSGHWGDQRQLDRFLQAYAVEKARIEARKKGHNVTEHLLADGSIRLSIQVAGGAA
ncbi:MAG: DUF1257 domain-containing protein [Planctomycetia bacterium]|nr:DUF1257 domain-containing protein [Planctomycetia bacterium]